MTFSNFTFKARLIPVLPFLFFEAWRIKRRSPRLMPVSEWVNLGQGDQSILILGESTAAGVGASHISTSISGQLNQLLDSQYIIQNIGKNGLKVSQVKRLLLNFSADIKKPSKGILLFIGANDCFQLTSPTEFQKELSGLIGFFETELKPEWIYLADIPPVQLFPAFSPLMKFFLKRQRSFLQEKMKFLAHHNPKIIFEEISIDLTSDFFSVDQIHPSDLGYQKISEFAINQLKSRNLFGQ